MANSFASEPPLANFTVVNCSGSNEVSRLASFSAGGLVDMVGALNASVRPCSAATSTIESTPCP